MIGTDLLQSVDAHIEDGKQKHPAIRILDNYPVIIRDWGQKLQSALAATNPEDRHALAGKIMQQLAGICLRGLHELDLPLTPPGAIE